MLLIKNPTSYLLVGFFAFSLVKFLGYVTCETAAIQLVA